MQADRLLRQLEAEADVAVQFLAPDAVLPHPLKWLQRLKFIRTFAHSFVYWTRLIATVRDCDLIHVMSASYASFLLVPVPALIVAAIYSRPTIVDYHSGQAADHLRRSRLARYLLRKFDRISVPSDYLVTVFRGFGLSARSMPNIIAFDQITYRRRVHARPLFLSNRNLEPLYNVECTLHAFKLITALYPEAHLDVVGDGRSRFALERLRNTLGLSQVTFHGSVPPDRMGAFYDHADIFINSSQIDNMPLSILEAQAAGLPVVTTDAGGIPLMVEHGVTGLLVRCGDVVGVANAAVRYLNEPDLVTIVSEQAAFSVAHYRAHTIARQWVELYTDMLRTRRPHSHSYH